MDKECYCKFKRPSEVCNFCVQVKCFLNFCAYKICMQKIPKNLQNNLVPLDDFLRDNMNVCETFFHFLGNRTNLKLDNPLEENMLGVKKVD